MSDRQRCFQKLEELYRCLDDVLPRAEGNPCGRCRECCSKKGLTAHNVTELELDYIAERVGGAERLGAFRRYLSHDGQVELCPFFDEAIWGCGIHAHRPYSCRVFGHHRTDSTALPSVCVFAGQEKIFRQVDYYRSVPLAAELRELVRDYWPFRSQPPELSPTGADGLTAPDQGGDALDRALILMGQGQLAEALLEFESADLPSTPYVLYCLSLVLEGLGRFDDACTALRVAKDEAPNCVPLWFRLGCNLFSAGHRSEAEEAFLRTVALDSEHALAHGFLGGHYLSLGRKTPAVEHLRRATALDPPMASFARLLEQAQQLT